MKNFYLPACILIIFVGGVVAQSTDPSQRNLAMVVIIAASVELGRRFSIKAKR